jgi:adenosine kinase
LLNLLRFAIQCTKNNMNPILVSGSLAYDRIMKFPGKFREHFHADKMHVLSVSFVVNTLEESFGGTAGNIAYNLALLREKPIIVSAVGGDFQKYREHLQKLGIDTNAMQLEIRIPTAVGHVITDDEDNQIAAFYAGAMARPYVQPIPEAALAIVAAGNALDMVELAQKIHKRGTPFFYDPGQQVALLSGEELRSGMDGAEVLFGNDYEISMLLKKTGWNAKELLQHVGAVVMTLGAGGSQITTADKEFKVAPVKAIDVLDPTGAGDAYRAGFAAAWLKKMPLETCAKVGSAVAVYAVESYGTQNHVFMMQSLKDRYEATYGPGFPL